jgi:replication factor C large subunit
LIEFNASDQRNEKVVSSLVSRASRTKPNPGFKGKIVLLDEVDGLAGTDDRGGVSALLKVSKLSRWPIVTTANDPYSSKLRTLRLRSKFLKLNLPSQREMTEILNNIIKKEGLTVNSSVIKNIVSSCHGDIRAAINDLMNLSQGREIVDKKALIALKERDYETVIYDALKKIFGGASSPLKALEATRDLDVDYKDFLNFVHENALHYVVTTEELVNIYDNISKADVYKSRIMREQEWGLLKYFYFHLSAGVRDAKKNPVGFGKPLQRYSAFFENWAQRQRRKDIGFKIGSYTHSSISKTLTSTLPYLEIIYSTLKKPKGKKGLTREENPTLHQVAKITYANDFTSSDLEYFYKKTSSVIPWILESVEELEGDLVKEYIAKDKNIGSKLTKIINDDARTKNSIVKTETKDQSTKQQKKEDKQGSISKKKTQQQEKDKATHSKTKSKKKKLKELPIKSITDEEKEHNGESKIEKEEKKKTKNLMDFF